MGCPEHGLHHLTFLLRHLAEQLGSLGIGPFGQTSGLLDNLAESLVTTSQRVVAPELHLTLDGDVLLLVIIRATADIDLVVWL